jgi:hypothetical protein
VKWRDIREQVRENPKQAFQGDLIIAVAGLVIVFIGSMVAAGGLYGNSRTNPSGPHPLVGTVILFVGTAVIVLGLVIAVVNVGVYLTAKWRSRNQSGSP